MIHFPFYRKSRIMIPIHEGCEDCSGTKPKSSGTKPKVRELSQKFGN